MAEVANYGTASVRRIYGDWTSQSMKGWRDCLLEYSISPIQQFPYTTGKNATDGAMIIDAMDLLYTGRFSSFCLVSSDSDFTRLAARIREQGITVYGFGHRKTTNNALVAACNKFIYFDALTMPLDEPEESGKATLGPDLEHSTPSPSTAQQSSTTQGLVPPRGPRIPTFPSTLPLRPQSFLPIGPRRRTIDQAALSALASAIRTSAAYEEDYVNLADVGDKLSRIAPDVNARNYGFERLRDFTLASGIVELKTKSMDPHPPIPLVRLKRSTIENLSD